MRRMRDRLTRSRVITGAVVVALAATGMAAGPAAPAGADPAVTRDADQQLYAFLDGLATRFGDDPGYAGVHLVNDVPTVNVTSRALAAELASLGTATRVVSTPLAKLESAAARVEAQAGDSVVAAVPDISENRLYVTVPGAEPDARASEVVARVRAAGVPVTVDSGAEVADLAAHYGGWGITSNWRGPTQAALCTAGFNARNSAGDSVIITAGHCGPVGSDWFSERIGGFLGVMNRRNYGGTEIGVNDWGIIGAFAGVHHTPAQIKDAGVTKYVVRHRQPVEGMRVCSTGRTTGTRCGTVTNFVPGRYIATNIVHAGGDSGGPLYRRIPGTINVAALGIVSKGNSTTTIYQPIFEILDVANLTLKTRQ